MFLQMRRKNLEKVSLEIKSCFLRICLRDRPYMTLDGREEAGFSQI